jgi:hypothetical protein
MPTMPMPGLTPIPQVSPLPATVTPLPMAPAPLPSPAMGPLPGAPPQVGPLPGPVTPLPMHAMHGAAIPQLPDPSRPPGDSAPIEAPGARRQFDMARNETVGRLVWICVLVIVGVIGIVVAARL